MTLRIYIREHFGIDMPVRTMGEYLKRWGFMPQNPIKVAYDPFRMVNLKVHQCKPVKEWLEKNKERIEVFYLERVKTYFKDKHVAYAADSQ